MAWFSPTFLYEVESKVKSRLVSGTESISRWILCVEVLWAIMLRTAGGPSVSQPWRQQNQRCISPITLLRKNPHWWLQPACRVNLKPICRLQRRATSPCGAPPPAGPETEMSAAWWHGLPGSLRALQIPDAYTNENRTQTLRSLAMKHNLRNGCYLAILASQTPLKDLQTFPLSTIHIKITLALQLINKVLATS